MEGDVPEAYRGRMDVTLMAPGLGATRPNSSRQTSESLWSRVGWGRLLWTVCLVALVPELMVEGLLVAV